MGVIFFTVEDEEVFCHSANEESTSEDCESDSGGSESDEKEHIGSIRYKHEDANSNWTILQHRHAVVFIYIGLLYLNEPITVADLLRYLSPLLKQLW